jgi:hypothetical protein
MQSANISELVCSSSRFIKCDEVIRLELCMKYYGYTLMNVTLFMILECFMTVCPNVIDISKELCTSF